MSTNDKKLLKKPKRLGELPSQDKAEKDIEELKKLLKGVNIVEGRVRGSVHVYGPIIRHGSKKQRIISQITTEFEKLLATGSGETLKKALAALAALQEEKPAPLSVPQTKLVILRNSTDGNLVVDNNPRKPRRGKVSMSFGGGTGSTGPGKPKVKK